MKLEIRQRAPRVRHLGCAIALDVMLVLRAKAVAKHPTHNHHYDILYATSPCTSHLSVAGSSDALSGPKPAARTIDVGTRLRPQAEGVRLSKAGREATDSAGKARHYRHSRRSMDDWRESVIGRADVITGKRSGTFGVECERGSVREHSRVYLIWRVVYCCLHVGARIIPVRCRF